MTAADARDIIIVIQTSQKYQTSWILKYQAKRGLSSPKIIKPTKPRPVNIKRDER
jgi:hypothetical protein